VETYAIAILRCPKAKNDYLNLALYWRVNNMDSYLLQIFNGISVSSVLLLAALGLAITFGL